VEHSGLLRKFAQTALPDCQLGVFGRICRPEQILQSGDRVEIYHPLLADPKTARRDRARRQTKQD
jgi:putative ubiquitin-RnfH superfamily antitoxin RatB of RatAB toxin-antitoxin module